MTDRTAVLEVEQLSVGYVARSGVAAAVDRVSLTVYENEIVGLVGESGCGKSTLANAIMRLLGSTAFVLGGTVKVLGEDVYALNAESLRQFRGTQMSMVFQGAMNALNPVKTIESQIVDMLRAHRPNISKVEAHERAEELFRLVRIDPERLKSFPHELSGGMRQRAVIAIAVALEPKFVIMDEPTTALDVVVQRSILEQIIRLREQVGFSILFISHDFNLVADLSDRTGVMYAGRLVEMFPSSGSTESMLHHPYTQGLMRAIPKLSVRMEEIEGIPGTPPNLLELPTGCPFHPRCPAAKPVCSSEAPPRIVTAEAEIECHLTANELESLSHVH